MSGEWFRLSEQQLVDAIGAAEGLAVELRSVEQAFTGLDELSDCVSDGAQLAPTAELKEWFHRWERAELLIKPLKELKERIVVLTKQANERGEDLNDVARVIEVPKKTLDKKELKNSHPDVYQRYLVASEKVTGRFIFERKGLKDLDLESEWPECSAFLASSNSILDRVHQGELGLPDVYRISFQLKPFEARADLDQTLAEGVLKRACGTAPGIDSICKWVRSLSSVEKFDEKRFVSENPELAFQFTSNSTTTRVIKNVGNRNFDEQSQEAVSESGEIA